MIAVALGLGAALVWGVADFLGGVVSRRAAAVTVALIAQACALVALAVVVGAARPSLPAGDAMVGAVAAGVAAPLGIVCLFAALAGGSMSVAAPIAAAGSVAIPAAFGLASGERPTSLQIAGVVAAAIGVVLVSRHAAKRSSADRRAILLALGGALGYGFSYVGIDAATGASFFSVLFVVRLTGVACLILAVAVARPEIRVTRRTVAASVVVGLLDLGGNALYFFATSEGLLIIASVLVSLYAVVTVLLAWLLLAERISGAQGVGVVFALGGAGMIAAGGG